MNIAKTKTGLLKSTAVNRLRLFCALLTTLAVGGHRARAQSLHSYPVRGVVEQIATDRRQATIQHEAIPGYMMAMTMEFPVRDTNELNGVSPGDKITFTLVVGQTNDWIENIRRVGRAGVTASVAPAGGERFSKPRPGEALPDGGLVSETGRRIRLSDFRGDALAFTFFYTRCPLPTYCPLMNRNFEQARALLLAQSNAPTNWQFLSISFDPQHDTPAVLSAYAGAYRGENPAHWLFAAATTNALARLAPRLGLMVIRQGGSISHNLRTVVLDPQGRIFRQFDGNQWTAQQLADAVREAASQNR